MTAGSTPLIRDAERRDAPQMVGVFLAAWQRSYRGVVPDDVIDGLDPAVLEAGFSSAPSPGGATVVAVDEDGGVVGFARFGPDPDNPAPDVGYLASLYVHPCSAGRGLGRRLVGHAIDRLAAAGRYDVSLSVFRDNAGARALYERCGFRPDGTETVDVRWRTPQLRYWRRPPNEARPMPSRHDDLDASRQRQRSEG